MLRTDELTSILKNKHADLDRYFEDCAGEMLYTDIGEYLCALLEKHGLRKTDLIFASGRERSYCYQILNGTRRNPSRDTLLAIALGLRFSLEETQTMLRIAAFLRCIRASKGTPSSCSSWRRGKRSLSATRSFPNAVRSLLDDGYGT